MIASTGAVEHWDDLVVALEPDRPVLLLAPGGSAADAVAALPSPEAPILLAASDAASAAFVLACELDRRWDHRPRLLFVRPSPPDGELIAGRTYRGTVDHIRTDQDDAATVREWRGRARGGHVVRLPAPQGEAFTGSDAVRLAAVVSGLY
ncbi:hypothetical protein HFP72_29380 [Nocardiopsis sp. ARC36]